jgi:hypothetical protein
MPGTDRSTIDIERSRQARGGWRSRDGRRSPGASRLATDSPTPPEARAPVPTVVEVAEPREPSVIPVGYEPPRECTCVEGWCDADHANE